MVFVVKLWLQMVINPPKKNMVTTGHLNKLECRGKVHLFQ